MTRLGKEHAMESYDGLTSTQLGERLLAVVKESIPIFRHTSALEQEIEGERRKLAAIAELIERGADINVEDENHETALHWAAYHRHLSIVQYLVANGADVVRKGLAQRTPLDWVRTSEAVARFLSQHTTEEQAVERVKDTLKRRLLDQFLARIGARRFPKPSCFVSYAWEGDEHKQWVKRFAEDLQLGGVNILLDVWDNPVGTRINEYIKRINSSDFVVLIGSPQLRAKYDAAQEKKSNPVIAAELSRIDARLMRNSEKPDTVIPVLRAGDPEKAFHPTIHDYTIVYKDLRRNEAYAESVLAIIALIRNVPDGDPGMKRIYGDLTRQFNAVEDLSNDEALAVGEKMDLLRRQKDEAARESVKQAIEDLGEPPPKETI